MLADRGHFGPDATRRLLDQDLITPVLDGLDEMAADLRPAAMEAFTQRVAQAQPLVLTRQDGQRSQAWSVSPGGADTPYRWLGD
jgi:hypothetical protein